MAFIINNDSDGILHGYYLVCMMMIHNDSAEEPSLDNDPQNNEQLIVTYLLCCNAANKLAYSSRRTIIIPAKAREYVFAGVGLCVCVCVSVTTISKKIVDGSVPNFMGRFLGKGETKFVFRYDQQRDVKVTIKNSVNRRLFTFYTCTMSHIRER